MPICQGSEFPGLHRVYLFSYIDRVLSRRRDAIMEGFWIFQDSKYAKFLHMRELHKVLNMYEYGWVISEFNALTMSGFWMCLIKVSQGFEYASGSRYTRARNMSALWICECYTGCWICLSKLECSVIMPQYYTVWQYGEVSGHVLATTVIVINFY